MSLLTIGLSFFGLMHTVSIWDLPGDVLAAPESALCGWVCVILLSLSLTWVLLLRLLRSTLQTRGCARLLQIAKKNKGKKTRRFQSVRAGLAEVD